MVKTLLSATALSLILAINPLTASAMGGKHDGEHKSKRFENFSTEAAEKVRTSFKEGMEAHKADFEKIKDLNKQKRELLVAKEFDAKAYRVLEDDIDAIKLKLDNAKEDRFIALASTLAQEDREALAKMHDRRGKWHHKKREHDDKKHDKDAS